MGETNLGGMIKKGLNELILPNPFANERGFQKDLARRDKYCREFVASFGNFVETAPNAVPFEDVVGKIREAKDDKAALEFFDQSTKRIGEYTTLMDSLQRFTDINQFVPEMMASRDKMIASFYDADIKRANDAHIQLRQIAKSRNVTIPSYPSEFNFDEIFKHLGRQGLELALTSCLTVAEDTKPVANKKALIMHIEQYLESHGLSGNEAR